MTWFDNLSLRGKLFLNQAIASGALLLAILFCLSSLQSVSKDANEIASNDLPSIQAAGMISQNRLRYRVRSLEFMLPNTAEEQAKIEKSLAALEKDVEKSIADYEPLAFTADEKKMIADLRISANAYRDAVQKAVALVKGEQADAAQEIRKTEWVTKANDVRDKTDALVKFNRDRSEQAKTAITSESRAAYIGTLVATLVALVVAIVFSILFSRRIVGRMQAVVGTSRRIAGGDLQGSIKQEGADEVGQLSRSVAEMQDSLRRALIETRDNATRITTTSSSLVSNVSHLETGASAQAEAASSIAANIEELTVSINHISEATNEANRLASESDKLAETGKATIEKLIEEIQNVATTVGDASQRVTTLADQSQQISQLVSVIKEIADQTNLLALNAAIEAARAGEQGRGFAVVADEVRKLSERTAQSTTQITTMVGAIQRATGEVVSGIQSGVEAVQISVEHARETGSAIALIQSKAKEVANVVSSTADGLREQTTAATDVARRVEQIASYAEESSGATASTAESARVLSAVAEEMQIMVGHFRV